MKKYQQIIDHYEACFLKYGDSPKGMDWPNQEDAVLRYQIMLDLIELNNDNERVSLLDFGCGTSHLLEYMRIIDINNIDYSGLDISPLCIETSQKKFPEITYYNLDILENSEQIPSFDYIVCNGIFTEKRELSFEEMWAYTQKMLPLIFSKAEKGIAFNMMSKAVDWERWDLFHLSTDLLIDFMTKELSRNFIIRNDYGLYEFTVYLYK